MINSFKWDDWSPSIGMSSPFCFWFNWITTISNYISIAITILSIIRIIPWSLNLLGLFLGIVGIINVLNHIIVEEKATLTVEASVKAKETVENKQTDS